MSYNEYMVIVEKLTEQGIRTPYNGMREFFDRLDTDYGQLVISGGTFASICELGQERSTQSNILLPASGLSYVNPDLSYQSLGDELSARVYETQRGSNLVNPGMSARVFAELLSEAVMTEDGLVVPGYSKPINHLIAYTNFGTDAMGVVFRHLNHRVKDISASTKFRIHEVMGDSGKRFDALHEFVADHATR